MYRDHIEFPEVILTNVMAPGKKIKSIEIQPSLIAFEPYDLYYRTNIVTQGNKEVLIPDLSRYFFKRDKNRRQRENRRNEKDKDGA